MNVTDTIQNNLMQQISPSSIFIYFIIFCVSIIYFRNINITLGVLLGLLIASICVYLLYLREITAMSNADILHQVKTENIKPTSENIAKYPDFTDLIFSIQDLYIYNPQSYENMIKTLDTFIEVLDDVMIDNSLAGEYYSIAEMRKEIALNSLQSIIIMIPPNKKLISKLNDAMQIFEQLFNKYLMIIYEKNIQYIKDNGYFNNTKLIELNIAPYNKYKNETFDQYY